MTEESRTSFGNDAVTLSATCGCCPNCNATHWITVSIAAQKKLDDLINLNLNQQLEIGQLRRHITELNAIIETRNLWRESERRH
jgi:hypothetical protein